MTGVIVRSAANVQAGAKSNLSAILHGAWLLLFVVFLTALLRIIPIAALAGILVYTGFKLIDWKGFLHLWRTSRTEAGIFLATVTVVVVEELQDDDQQDRPGDVVEQGRAPLGLEVDHLVGRGDQQRHGHFHRRVDVQRDPLPSRQPKRIAPPSMANQ